ncbi:MAG: IspD/TarI family cytidylyltransferase [Geminicoccaceae bacterium]
MALVMAAGSGLRVGGELPKQYQALAGQPMLRRTIEALRACPDLRQLQVVIGAGHEGLYAEATRGLELPPPVIGGATRQASVRHGLEALAPRAPSRVLVHDAARPFATAALVSRVQQGLARARAVLPVLPVVDTLKRVDGAGAVLAEVPRDGLGRAQTPQGFDFATVLQAHRRHAARDCTDDAGVVALDGVCRCSPSPARRRTSR